MKTKVFLLTAVLLLAGMTLFAPIYMNYVKIDGVPGDATAAGYQGWLNASSISFAPAAGTPAGAQTAGRCATHEIVIVKHIDKASPKLSTFCATGKHFPAVTVALAGERHLLQDVVVKSVQAQQMGDGSVQEVMTLNFAKCATHETVAFTNTAIKKFDYKENTPNAILIGLTPRPESAALVGLTVNGDGRSAKLLWKVGGGTTEPLRRASQSRQVIPTLTLTLSNGQKWTFTNVTVGNFTGGVKPGTEQVSLNFTKIEGPPAGFQDLSYKE